MRATLGSAGARSDLYFLFALAKTFHERGHSVTLIAPEKYRSQIMALGVRMVTCGRSFEEFFETDGTDRSDDLVNEAASQIAAQFVSLRDALREADVLVSGTLLFPAASMAEQLNLPHFHLIQSPLLLNAAQFPGTGVAYERTAGLLSSRRRNMLKKRWEDVIGKALNRERGVSNLGPVNDLHGYLFQSGHQLVPTDAELAPVEDNPSRTVTGFIPVERFGEAGDSIRDVLETGSPLVYLGPVSLAAEDRIAFVKELCVELRSSGHRLVVRSDWLRGRLSDLPLECAIADPPHELGIIARCSVSVHHGSAGLTAAAARAGIPQVVVPYLADQYFWGERVRVLGLGTEVSGHPGPKNIVAAVQKVAVDTALKERATVFAGKLNSRDGLKAAADLIEKINS